MRSETVITRPVFHKIIRGTKVKKPESLKDACEKQIASSLSPADQEYILQNTELMWKLENGIGSLLQKIKTNIPKKVCFLGECIFVPSFPPAKSKDSYFAKNAGGTHKGTFLYEEYSASPEVMLYPYKAPGVVKGSTLIESLGGATKNLFTHCITPTQADFLIDALKKKDSDKDVTYVFL
jgi:hypothetical protein